MGYALAVFLASVSVTVLVSDFFDRYERAPRNTLSRIGLVLIFSGLIAAFLYRIFVYASSSKKIAGLGRFLEKYFAQFAGGILLLLVLLVPVFHRATALKAPAFIPPAAGDKLPVKNIILITIDTLRSDALSIYNPQVAPTPHIDQLGREAILFKNAHTPAPWTLPSLSTIMTGVHPLVHGTNTPEQSLPPQFETLAEALGKKGYLTAAFAHNPYLNPRSYRVTRGFYETSLYVHDSIIITRIGTRLLNFFFPQKFKDQISTEDLTNEAVSWLHKNSSKNFFLWIHYLDPHTPYEPPEAFLPPGPKPFSADLGNQKKFPQSVFSPAQKEWVKELYRAEARYVDDNVGKLIVELRTLGLYDSSLIVLTSDHGEEFWEHGGVIHSHTLFEELLHVPLMIKLPGAGKPAQIDPPVSLESIYPTILELSGISYDPARLSASSLVPLWTGAPYEQAPLLAYREELPYSPPSSISVLFSGFKYMRFLKDGSEMLFYLNADPGEKQSLVGMDAEKLKEGRGLSDRLMQKAEALRRTYGLSAPHKLELDEETKNRLRSLGYLQ